MLLLSVSEFRGNISKYLKLATTEKIAVKSPSGIFSITPCEEIRTNPSPSNDPWFDDSENMASVERGIADVDAGRVQKWDDVKKQLKL